MMIDDDPGVPADAPVQVVEALKNVVHLLQQNPQRYRNFGIWWWPLKSLLKAAGYTQRDLFLLGNYVDPEVAAMVPEMDLQSTLQNAIEEFDFSLTYPHSDGRAENLAGELVAIVDQDAGGL